MKRTSLLFLGCLFALGGCGAYQPKDPSNICRIFHGETDWYEAAADANKAWGTPIQIMMAIMYQESRYVHNARPKRDWFLFIPLPRKSSAYGYAQAKDPVWKEYRKSTGNRGADRDDFDDAIDFIGWYTHGTHRQLNISKWDTYNQYLAYHEGRGGYKRKTYEQKGWLKQVAKKVARQADSYGAQLKNCKAKLDDEIDGWFF